VTTADLGPCAATPLLDGLDGPDGLDVLDVVVRLPKTMGPRATVAEARAAFADDHVHMLLLTDKGRLLGTLVPSDLPASGAFDAPASGYATLDGRTVPPYLPAEDARQLLLSTGQRRRAVVDPSGRLLGILCPQATARRFLQRRRRRRPAAERHLFKSPLNATQGAEYTFRRASLRRGPVHPLSGCAIASPARPA
jgi:CBS-domain-containing membrane protein